MGGGEEKKKNWEFVLGRNFFHFFFIFFCFLLCGKKSIGLGWVGDGWGDLKKNLF